jgi:hypothetical protein
VWLGHKRRGEQAMDSRQGAHAHACGPPSKPVGGQAERGREGVGPKEGAMSNSFSPYSFPVWNLVLV